ncbi:hypothetical protein OG225_41725 (plasmid) [Nocardia sp. NBC_01377]|uniref:hypothetical protein n=1 Tax=Nocardia sp. NBC_01377 TaxID=2903595 RepID=UPI00324B5EF8
MLVVEVAGKPAFGRICRSELVALGRVSCRGIRPIDMSEIGSSGSVCSGYAAVMPTTRFENGQLVIDGYDSAVAVVDLHGYGGRDRKVAHLGDLAKHHIDLAFVVEATERLLRFPGDPTVVRTALWRSAIVTFARCFDTKSNARQLDLEAAKVYQAGLPRQLQKYMQDLRDKDIAHDDALVTDSKVCAVLGPDNPDTKVIEVLFLHMNADQLSDPTAVPNLRRLAQDAFGWVVAEFERRRELLVEELRGLPYEQLVTLPVPTIQPKKYPHPVSTP